jgi:hypothetical protein
MHLLTRQKRLLPDDSMKTVLILAAGAEAATGILLLALPSLVIRLLFDAEITGAGEVVGRFTGIALIGLGVACWPGDATRQPLRGMLIYGTLAALYLATIGVRGETVGPLLWPAVVAHAILVILLLRTRSGIKS